MTKTIALLLSGSYITQQQRDTVVSVLTQQGFDVVLPEISLTAWSSPLMRAKAAIALFQRNDIDYYWCVRGGEGASDCLPYFHQYATLLSELPKKTIIGMSDATAWLHYFFRQYRWPVVHMVNAVSYTQPNFVDGNDRRVIKKMLFDAEYPFHIPVAPLNSCAREVVSLSAPVIAGNLSMLNISIGDASEFDVRGKILCVEDWHEPGYVVARTLKYLQRIGKLRGAEAIVFGDFFVDMPDPNQRHYLSTILQRFADSCDFPVYSSDAFGHGARQIPLVFGQVYTL